MRVCVAGPTLAGAQTGFIPLLLPLVWCESVILMLGMCPGTATAPEIASPLALVLLDLGVSCAAVEEPVEVSDIEEPDEENGGNERSEGDGDGGLR